MPKRVLSIDPGAERLGWSALEKQETDPPIHLGLGYFGIPRKVNGSNTPYQEYRLSLIDFWIDQTPILLDRYKPDEVVCEIVPPNFGGNTAASIQGHLAICASTTIQVIARQRDLPVIQIGATTVKTRIGGDKKASKAKVRNGIIKIMPELERFKKEWTASKVWDVSDAVAIGLTHWGYKCP